ALALFQEADAQLADHPVKPVWVAAFYFEMALCLANVKDAKKDYSRADILQVLDKGLAVDPSSYDCREYKAWLLKKDSRYEEALAIYKELEAMPRQSLYIEEQMAEIYYNKAYFYADKAYDYYKRLEEDKNASPEYHMDLAYCSYRMMEFDRVREECKKALALDSDQPYAYYLMGLAALVESRLEEALLFGDKAIELAKKQDRVPGLFWSVKIRALRRMDRLKDAVDAIMDRSRYATDDPHTYSDLIAVSMQDGSYGSAMKLVHLLRRKKLHEGLAAETTAIVEIFSGRYKKAQKVLDSEEEAMGFDEKHMIRSLLAAAEGDFSVLEDYRRKALTRAENDDIADPFAQWTNLAMALWLGDKTEEAAEAAFRALQIIGQAEKRFSLDVPIRLGHQAVCLALTGDEAGARQALADMQDAPKCDFCGYPTCKDHTVYTCEAEMILGNTDKAASMLYFSLKGFPDEEVFLLLKFYLMKKGVL
ncbi:MAG: hypothetical protein HUJ80_09705, partial [Firmicutes bacterium]|nr:hypothetical protein [Bacillota bacterium]